MRWAKMYCYTHTWKSAADSEGYMELVEMTKKKNPLAWSHIYSH